MSADEARDWSVDDIASRVYVAAPSVAALLHSLHQHRLIETADGGAHYRFSPASDEERQTVRQTAEAYRSHLIPIATLIHRKTSNPVQEFARAFSLKKDD